MMANAPLTRASLLERLRDLEDEDAWTQFVHLYAPLVYGYLRKRGLQDADAADLTQDVLRGAAQHLPEFDYRPERGSFRGWLFTVVRSRLSNFRTRRRERGAGLTDNILWLQEQPDPQQDEDRWEREYQQRLFAWAAEQVRPRVPPHHWQAFWRISVDGATPVETAKALGMSLTAVYTAKSRVLARIREAIEQQEEGHDGR
jgi:RNA polymerase sigma factor (sigma-70 family)